MNLIFKKSESASICTSLWCGNAASDTCIAQGGNFAAEGSTCGVGKGF